MKTRSSGKCFLSLVLVLLMLLSLVPMSALAATYDEDGNITSTSLTLYNFAYGKSVMSGHAGGELGIVFVDKTIFYESTKATPTSMEDLTETTDASFQAGKQYFCAIRFSEHPDLSLDPENCRYFARELTATLDCNGVSCEMVLDLSGNSKEFVYKLPILEALPYGIDVTVDVEQGGNVAPTTGNFELEVLNVEERSNLPIDAFTIGGKEISTDGIGKFDSKLTIGHDDYEKLFYLFNEGILVKQKKGTAEGWTYDESVWFVELHQDPVVNALSDDVETMPNIKFDCFKGKMADGEFVPDSQTPADKITFTNIYTENKDSIVTVKLPFTKKVTLGGDIAPTDETFKFEIFDIGNGNDDDYADVTYTAEVKVNGKGEFEGEISITGPESQVEQYISEGFFVREVKGDAANWTYSDAVWCVVPEWNEQQERVFVVYPTTKETSANGDYYAVAEEPSEKMIFENIYTESEAVVTVKIPFVKKVTLGGNVAPTGETFKLEIFDIGNGSKDNYADVTYTAEVKVNGKGEFEGELIITGPEGQVDQMICEGFYVREIDGKVKNWKYSEDVWHIVPESVPVENDGIIFVPNLPDSAINQGQTEPEMIDVLSIYPTTKIVDGDNVYYEDAAETAQKMIFENIYTENKAVDTPQTGDNSMMGLWIALLLASCFGVVVTTVIRKKRSVR